MSPLVLAESDFLSWLPEEGQEVFAAAKSLNGPLMVERSVKWVEGEICTDRFLMSLPKSSLYPGPKRQLEKLCTSLGCSVDGMAELTKRLSFANNIHLGFEPEATANRLKCYLEFPPNSQPEPNLVFFALKWVGDGDQHSSVMSRYWSRSSYRDVEKQSLMNEVIREGRSRYLMHHIFALVAKSNNQAALLEVEEPGNPRRSLDINLSDQKCGFGDLKEALPAELRSHFKTYDDMKIGHVAVGVSRNGTSFITLYYGAERVA